MNDKTTVQVNLDDDLDSIIKAKMNHHEEQIKFHQEQYKQLLSRLNSNHSNGNGQQAKAPKDSDTDKQFDKPWYWEQRIPELISNHFINKEFKNSDIVELEGVDMEGEDFKRKVRYAVSMALSALVTKQEITFRKKSGMKGYLYKKK